MIAMEAAMNITDVVLTGGAVLTWWVIPFMLLAGFHTAAILLALESAGESLPLMVKNINHRG